MDCSTINKEFLVYTKEAVHKYENLQIPFTAVKICIRGFGADREEIDKIVCDNFRSDKDIILRSKNDYAILMQNTSIEDAEAVTHRLRGRLSRLTPDFNQRDTISPIGATAWIYGAGQKTKALHFRYLDLIHARCHKKAETNWPGQVGEYLKWKEHSRAKNYKPFHAKV
jgi:hypothetical protein